MGNARDNNLIKQTGYKQYRWVTLIKSYASRERETNHKHTENKEPIKTMGSIRSNLIARNHQVRWKSQILESIR